MITSQTEIKYLQGIGPKKAEIFKNEINVKTIEDLLNYFPYRYIDHSKFTKIAEIKNFDTYVQIQGYFTNFNIEITKSQKILIGNFTDENGRIEIIWFKNLDFFSKHLNTNKTYIIFGRTYKFKDHPVIVHPLILEPHEFKAKITNPIMPEYRTTQKMKNNHINSNFIAKLIQQIFNSGLKIEEFLPEKILKTYDLLPIEQAYYYIHLPLNFDLLEKAKFRLKFNEILVNQLSLLQQKILRQKNIPGYIFKNIGENFNYFYYNKLPFPLTEAQKRVIKEIRKDFLTGRQGNRLLQGDVGSGKTIVALMCMLIAKDNGFQSCLMAPTEVLAQQHFETFKNLTDGMNLNIRLLTGSTTKKQRQIINDELLDGSLDILIGTHALIEDNIVFRKLGLVVIDEQHKFGVAQRAKLYQKSKIPPHVIVMSATPIPRTLSMALYGDLDVSVIDELPQGRKPIITKHIYDFLKPKLYEFIKKEIEKGRQVYIVYPLIKESESLDYKNLEEGHKNLLKIFPEPQYQIAVVHGKMSSEEKKTQMELFISGKAQILLSTTVIEVGVNVPNATIMVIENAERFGLSQLHQLRGRVGRASHQSYCILVTPQKISKDALKRINTMVKTNNGFEIAEVDLKLRGPGDIFGTQQSGIPLNFKITDLASDLKIMNFVRDIATKILEEDPSLQHPENQKLSEIVKKEILRSYSHIS